MGKRPKFCLVASGYNVLDPEVYNVLGPDSKEDPFSDFEDLGVQDFWQN